MNKPTELQSRLIVKKQKSQNIGKVDLTNIDQQAITKSFFKNGTMCSMKFFQFFLHFFNFKKFNTRNSLKAMSQSLTLLNSGHFHNNCNQMPKLLTPMESMYYILYFICLAPNPPTPPPQTKILIGMTKRQT